MPTKFITYPLKTADWQSKARLINLHNQKSLILVSLIVKISRGLFSIITRSSSMCLDRLLIFEHAVFNPFKLFKSTMENRLLLLTSLLISIGSHQGSVRTSLNGCWVFGDSASYSECPPESSAVLCC